MSTSSLSTSETHATYQIEPQRAAVASIGMWFFIASEIMFFGGLLTSYAYLRGVYPEAFAVGAAKLSIPLGSLNTVILLISSFTMMLAVHYGEHGRASSTRRMLATTGVLGLVFLIVKGFEYYEKFQHHLVPGINFILPADAPAQLPLFMWLYFIMTAVHALHLLIGMAMLAYFAARVSTDGLSPGVALRIETLGLYWHFVDIIWIFLFPLLYLIEVTA